MRCKLLKLSIESALYLKHDLAQIKLLIWRRNKLDTQLIFSSFLHAFRQLKSIHKSSGVVAVEATSVATSIGGGKIFTFDAEQLSQYTQFGVCQKNAKYKFEKHMTKVEAQSYLNEDEDSIFCQLPMSLLITQLTLKQLKHVAALHNIHIAARTSMYNAREILGPHSCDNNCKLFGSIFKFHLSSTDRKRIRYQNLSQEKKAQRLGTMKKYNSTSAYEKSHKKTLHEYYEKNKDAKFPPLPSSNDLLHRIISDSCADTSPNVFTESGCAVCGKLT